MRFDLIGKKPKREREKLEDGDVLGEKRISCHRCDREFPESELTTIPPGNEPGRPRVYVCRSCR